MAGETIMSALASAHGDPERVTYHQPSTEIKSKAGGARARRRHAQMRPSTPDAMVTPMRRV